jgi:hypothetical protein
MIQEGHTIILMATPIIKASDHATTDPQDLLITVLGTDFIYCLLLVIFNPFVPISKLRTVKIIKIFCTSSR